MPLTIDTFEDLVHIVETHPEWRWRLKNALFDVDVDASVREFREAMARLAAVEERVWPAIERLLSEQRKQSEDIAELKTDVSVLKTDVAILKTDVAILKTDVAVLKTDVAVLKTDVAVLKTDVADTRQRVTRVERDVATLKGKSYEHDYRLKSNAIFGRFVRRGRDRTDDMADLMHEATQSGQITEKDLTQVLASDLLWGGKTREEGEDVVIVLEASWRAEEADVERAQQRAGILRRIGVSAIPVVAGTEWDEKAAALAESLGVAVASNGSLDGDSWRKAIAV